MSQVCLQFVIVVFPNHTHLLFLGVQHVGKSLDILFYKYIHTILHILAYLYFGNIILDDQCV